MLSCVRCGQCLTSCPTYVLSGREAEGPRGRVALARALHDGVLPLTRDLLVHEQNCLVCDACTAVCPAGVHMDPLQVAFRTAVEPTIRRGGPERLIRRLVFRQLFPNMGLFRAFVFLLWVYQALGIQKLARALGIVRLLGMKDAEAFLPRVQRPFLVPKGEVYPSEGPVQVADTGVVTEPAVGESAAATASFFAGCVMSTALADIDRATIRVLQRAGCEVVNTAGQGCCGALNAHGGDLDAALMMARRNIEAFERDGTSRNRRQLGGLRRDAEGLRPPLPQRRDLGRPSKGV